MADNSTRIIISAEDRATAALRSVQQNLTSVASIAARVVPQLTALSGALTVGGLASFAKGAIDAADSINDIAVRTGVSVKNLAEWQLALQQNGATMDGMATGLRNLSVYMVEHGDKLRAAGITAKDARGAFLQLADLFKALPEGPERAALAVEIFKKSGQELLPVLVKGSEELKTSAEKSRDYARAMAELAPQADAFNDTLAEIQLNLKAGAINALVPYMDGLNKMADLFNKATQSGTGLKDLLLKINEAVGGGGMSVLSLAARGVYAAYLMGYGGDASKRTSSGLIGGRLALPGGNNPTELAARKAACTLYGGTWDAASNTCNVNKPTGSGKSGGTAPDAASWMTSDMVRMMREEEQMLKRIADEAERRAAADERANQSLIDLTTNGKLQALAEQQDRAAQLLSSGRITFEGYDEIMDRLAGIGEAGQDTFDDLTRAIEGWSQRAADAFADFAASGMRSFSDLGSFADNIMRQMISMTANELLFKPMFDDIKKLIAPTGSGGGGNAWTWIKSAFGFAEGGVMSPFGPLPLQRYATGGIANTPQLALYGEGRMNEAYVPLPDGRSIPVTMRGGAQTIVVNVNSTTGDRAEIRRSAAAGARAALGIMSGARRYG